MKKHAARPRPRRAVPPPASADVAPVGPRWWKGVAFRPPSSAKPSRGVLRWWHVVPALVGFAAAAWLLSDQAHEAAQSPLTRGEAAAVLSRLVEVAESDRSGAEALRMGEAYAALDNPRDALWAYVVAARRGAWNDDALALAMHNLGQRDAAPGLELLRLTPTAWSEDALVEALDDEAWWTRRHAAQLLRERGQQTLIDDQALALADIIRSPACRQRREGLLRLARVAVDRRAVEALDDVDVRQRDAQCMKHDIDRVRRAVLRRLNER